MKRLEPLVHGRIGQHLQKLAALEKAESPGEVRGGMSKALGAGCETAIEISMQRNRTAENGSEIVP